MRVGFAGTPEFAAAALGAILNAGFAVPLVLSQPDRPKGRGLAVSSSPVKQLAECSGVPVATPASLKSAEARAPIVSVPLDVLVVAAYGLILPAEVLHWPTYGCINIHASLLPRWRGAAPIQRALLAGDAETGITIMQMDPGLDTGPAIEAFPVAIGPRETAGSLHDKLAALGARAIVEVLGRLARDGRVEATPQNAVGATYAAKIERRDAAIDWAKPAAVVDRQIRAFNPTPGAFTSVAEATWKIWRAEPRASSGDALPGTIVSDRPLTVACGDGTLVLHELQGSGGRRSAAEAVVAGRKLKVGDRFDSTKHAGS